MMKLTLLIVLSLRIGSYGVEENQTDPSPGFDNGRDSWDDFFHKSDKFIPSHYDIDLRPIFEDGPEGTRHSMPGKVRIVGTTYKKTNKIRLTSNCNELNISSVKVISNGAPIPIENVNEEGLHINLEQRVGGGNTIEVYIEYIAKIQQEKFWKGFLHLPCDTKNDAECNKTQIAVSGFNIKLLGTHCGTIFPCVGDRDLSSTFNLSLSSKNEYGTAANGELVSTSPDSELKGWTVDKYTWSTKQRWSLLAFTVFKDYSYVESFFGKEKKPVKIYAPKEHINSKNGLYTSIVSSVAKILTFYEEYFGTSANVPKMELFFVPTTFDDFGTWFMKSKGLNFYNVLDIIPNKENEKSTEIRVIQHVAESLARQWVGDWWDPEPEMSFLFIESILRYMEYLGLSQVNPALVEAAIYYDIQKAEELDREERDADIQFIVSHKRKVTLLFRMFEGITGWRVDSLQSGIRNYFNRLWNENGTKVTTEELYEILQNSTESQKLPFDVATILSSFVDNVGIPLVRVGIANETHFVFKQERFRYQESIDKINDGVWYLPVTYTHGIGNTRHTIWLTPDQNVTYVQGNTSELLLVNPDATGYYRTLYEDSSLLQMLQQQLEMNHTEIKPLTRAVLLSDYFTFADEKYETYGAALNLTTYLSEGSTNETSLVVWKTFLSKFSGTYDKFISHPQYPRLKNFLSAKLTNVLDYTSSPKTSEEIILRDYLLETACKLNNPHCQTMAKELFSQWRVNPNDSSPLDHFYPASRPILECAIVRNGGQEAYDFIMAKYRQGVQADGTTTWLTRYILKSLACASDKTIFKGFIELILTPPPSGAIKGYNLDYITDHVLSTPLPDGREMLLPFIFKNFDLVFENSGTYHGIPAMINKLTRSWEFSTAEKKKEIQELFKLLEKKVEGVNAMGYIRQVYEQLDVNIQWMDNQGNDILSTIP
ncbi:unnamed protein product [Orchesella dallaii]|uniref:Aminopeptidase n=1 Tax=Orchesella dallaii TaxID=48710 RepID=A0ABP1RSF9_9HEXA